MPEVGIHVGDVGTVIEVTVTANLLPVNIANATVKQYLLKSPRGSAKVRNVAFKTDGTDGQLKYILAPGDIDTYGVWSIQVYIETPNGEWGSDIDEFVVYENLQ
jgi:hypothetical protein